MLAQSGDDRFVIQIGLFTQDALPTAQRRLRMMAPPIPLSACLHLAEEPALRITKDIPVESWVAVRTIPSSAPTTFGILECRSAATMSESLLHSDNLE